MLDFKNKIDKQEKGIWRYANFYDVLISEENRLSFGNNRIKEIEIKNINKFLNIEHLYFKREDENLVGSIKDRSLAYQVSLAKQKKRKELVISTSGNAGIAAAMYCKKAKIRLYIFISPETEVAKIIEMQKYNPVIIKSKRAIRFANYVSAKYKIENLRPSINDSSIEGFKSIAFELFENLGEIDAIFTFVTSGSSFVGISRAFHYLFQNKEIKKLPKLFAVQSGEIFSIASEFEEIKKQKSIAGKLGVKDTKRKKEIIEFIKSSKGKGIYISEQETLEAKNLFEKNKIETSLESCASLAGVIQESKRNNFNKVVCILSGKLRNNFKKIEKQVLQNVENFEEVDKIITSFI